MLAERGDRGRVVGSPAGRGSPRAGFARHELRQDERDERDADRQQHERGEPAGEEAEEGPGRPLAPMRPGPIRRSV